MTVERGRDVEVSAVIPARNAAQFIAEAIASVLGQTFAPMECIVVDDGSTDESARIARSFGTRVRVISTPHRGVSCARNTGAAEASGDYIAFLDADDMWIPHKIEYQVAVATRRPDVGLVYTGIDVVDATGGFLRALEAPAPNRALWNTLMLEGVPVSVALTGLIRRDIFLSVGGFDPKLSTSADCEFVTRLALQYPLEGIIQPLAKYRIHSGQMHLDPKLTQSDMEQVFAWAFNGSDLGDEVKRHRRRAVANLHLSLAARYLSRRNTGRFLRHAMHAAVLRPDRVFHALGRLSREGLTQTS